MDVSALGKFLIIAGIAVAMAGAVLLLVPRIPWLGRLPGDIVVHREGFTLFVPIFTMIIVSVVLTILLNGLFRFFR